MKKSLILAWCSMVLGTLLMLFPAEAAEWVLTKADPDKGCTHLSKLGREIADGLDQTKTPNERLEFYNAMKMKYPKERQLDALFVYILRPPYYPPQRVESELKAQCVADVKAGRLKLG